MDSKLRLAPHLYNKMLGELMDAVMTYGQTQQLRTHLAKVVDQYVDPDHPHTRPAPEEPQFYRVSWCWRTWEVNEVITTAQYDLLMKYPEVRITMRDFRGYGNDEEFTPNDLSYTPVTAEMAAHFSTMCSGVNEEVLNELIRAAESAKDNDLLNKLIGEDS